MPVSKHEDKMLNLQVQLRQNQAEMQDYLADLENWEADIKKKEAQLKSLTGKKPEDSLPPVRNTIHKKKLKKKNKEKPIDPNKPKKISGYDFRAWDKFDVDKALDEIDNEEEKQETSSEYETDEEWEMERKKHLAGQQKEKGNDFLKRGEYDLAVEAYSKGMEYDPTNPILPANRAMALLKQQKFAAAEFDSTTSISLDPLYIKAYLRRATARSAMGKLQEAVADFNRVLDLEPNNKQAKMEIERLQKELERDKEEPVAPTLTEDERGIVKPIYKPPEDRSKKPLVRVHIEEIGLETTSRPSPSVQQSDLAKSIVDKEKKEFDKLFANQSSTSAKPHTRLKPDVDPLASGDGVSKTQSENLVKESVIETKDNSTSVSIIEEMHSPLENSPSKSLPSETSPSPSKSTSLKKEKRLSSSLHQVNGPSEKVLTNGGSAEVPPVPQTSFQLQSDFKVLKNKPQSFFEYFRAISPSCYPKLFGQSFDADILMTILRTLETFPDQADLYNILTGLTEVKRFSMTAMFLSRKDKTVAKNLLDLLKKEGKCTDAELGVLMKKYDL